MLLNVDVDRHKHVCPCALDYKWGMNTGVAGLLVGGIG